MRILLVEDEKELAESTAQNLRAKDFDVDIAENLTVAWESVQSIDYPLVLLDRRLPDGDGLSLIVRCKRLQRVPRFLVLSALGDVEQKVDGLNVGAHDYIVKPCHPKELLARIEAMLRLPRASKQGLVEVAHLKYDRAKRSFRIGEEDIELRRSEYLILELLITNAGQVVRKNDILDRIYGFDEVPVSNSMESNLSRLRGRLKKADAGVEIHTLRGLGYSLRKEKSN